MHTMCSLTILPQRWPTYSCLFSRTLQQMSHVARMQKVPTYCLPVPELSTWIELVHTCHDHDTGLAAQHTLEWRLGSIMHLGCKPVHEYGGTAIIGNLLCSQHGTTWKTNVHAVTPFETVVPGWNTKQQQSISSCSVSSDIHVECSNRLLDTVQPSKAYTEAPTHRPGLPPLLGTNSCISIQEVYLALMTTTKTHETCPSQLFYRPACSNFVQTTMLRLACQACKSHV